MNTNPRTKTSIIGHVYRNYYRDHYTWFNVPFGEFYGYPMLVDYEELTHIEDGRGGACRFVEQRSPGYDTDMLRYGYSAWPIQIRDCWRVKPVIPNKN